MTAPTLLRRAVLSAELLVFFRGFDVCERNGNFDFSFKLLNIETIRLATIVLCNLADTLN